MKSACCWRAVFCCVLVTAVVVPHVMAKEKDTKSLNLSWRRNKRGDHMSVHAPVAPACSGRGVLAEECFCDIGFEGPHCERLACSGHGARTERLENGQPDVKSPCVCAPGYTGHHCETPVCSGAGHLRNDQCICDPGHFGPVCNETKGCVYGSWQDSICVCHSGYHGDDCSLGRDCCLPFPGPGGCRDSSVFQCVCEFDSYCCTVSWDLVCIAQMHAYKCSDVCVETINMVSKRTIAQAKARRLAIFTSLSNRNWEEYYRHGEMNHNNTTDTDTETETEEATATEAEKIAT
eukprot:GILK01001326.1.p1 GENE.GILK01001326.1~~GILK01001326.1.p1  ORF type:complete len:291 (-),score=12.70 GILK01001326.1:177-1049(-)